MYFFFRRQAEYLHQAYGANLILEINDDEINSADYEGDNPEIENIIGYYCPECGEPVYYSDWCDDDVDTENWTQCPICEFKEED